MKKSGYNHPSISGHSAKVLEYFESGAAPFVTSALEDLERAVKFSLGAVSDLVDFNATDKPAEIHLPFDLMAVECTTIVGEEVVCLFKRTASETLKVFLFIRRVVINGVYKPNWQVSAGWVEFNTSDGTRSCDPDGLAGIAAQHGVEEAIVCRCVEELAQRGWLVLSCLNSLLECRNIYSERIAPPVVTGLGRKKRKLLRFEYLVLVIRNHIANGRPGYSGSHRSPRFHMRRGHIRCLASGLKTWISPCVVGSPELGIIEKSYQVEVCP